MRAITAAILAAGVLLSHAIVTRADTATITSTQPGATVWGAVTIQGQVCTDWVNLATYDARWNKIRVYTTPGCGPWSTVADAMKLLESGSQTVNGSGSTVAVEQPGGRMTVISAPTPPSEGPTRPTFLPSNFVLKMNEEFKTMPKICSYDQEVKGNPSACDWLAHTAWHGDWNTFDDLGSQYDPFSLILGGGLRIRTQLDSLGKPHSGMISTINQYNEGFDCTHCYFEARIKLPSGPGLWPAFWLGSQHLVNGCTAEIDIEFDFGKDDRKGFYPDLHTWCKGADDDRDLPRVTVPSDTTTAYHTYGIYVNNSTVDWYFDGQKLYSTPVTAAAGAPIFPMVNNGYSLQNGQLYPGMSVPNDLLVQWVRVWGAP